MLSFIYMIKEHTSEEIKNVWKNREFWQRINDSNDDETAQKEVEEHYSEPPEIDEHTIYEQLTDDEDTPNTSPIKPITNAQRTRRKQNHGTRGTERYRERSFWDDTIRKKEKSEERYAQKSIKDALLGRDEEGAIQVLRDAAIDNRDLDDWDLYDLAEKFGLSINRILNLEDQINLSLKDKNRKYWEEWQDGERFDTDTNGHEGDENTSNDMTRTEHAFRDSFDRSEGKKPKPPTNWVTANRNQARIDLESHREDQRFENKMHNLKKDMEWMREQEEQMLRKKDPDKLNN